MSYSDYYRKREAKYQIGRKLSNMPGWEVFGLQHVYMDNADNYEPADWSGLARKGDYVLCCCMTSSAKPRPIYGKLESGSEDVQSIKEKIAKLQNMTVDNGASESEEESAQNSIEKLYKKLETMEVKECKRSIIGYEPGHRANPSGMTWHIEHNGVIIDCGRGIIEFYKLDNSYRYNKEDIRRYLENKDEFIKQFMIDIMKKNPERSSRGIIEYCKSHITDMEEYINATTNFDNFIKHVDFVASPQLITNDGSLKKKFVTKYDTTRVPFNTDTGIIEEGQCVRTLMKVGYYDPGTIFVIQRRPWDKKWPDGPSRLVLCEINPPYGKRTLKSRSLHVSFDIPNDGYIQECIDKGVFTWCEIRDVKEPYTIVKLVEVKNK